MRATQSAAEPTFLPAFSYWILLTDFQFGVFNLHLMDAARFRIFLTYLSRAPYSPSSSRPSCTDGYARPNGAPDQADGCSSA